jgi:hypothetical protein
MLANVLLRPAFFFGGILEFWMLLASKGAVDLSGTQFLGPSDETEDRNDDWDSVFESPTCLFVTDTNTTG